jgi:hypothetical protein
MSAITERGICERCGGEFTSTRLAYLLRYSRVAPKRFCSERCRKVEESRRYRRLGAREASTDRH